MSRFKVLVMIFLGTVIGGVVIMTKAASKIISDNMDIDIVTKENTEILSNYQNNLDMIKNEMDEIALPNEEGNINWYKLNGKKIDKDLEEIYTSMMRDIRICYLYATDDGSVFTDSNYVGRFNSYEKIKAKEFNSLIKGYSNNNKDCLSRFNGYYESYFTEDKKYEEVKDLINKARSYYQEIKDKEFKNYTVMLDNENKKIEIIKEMADLLYEKVKK